MQHIIIGTAGHIDHGKTMLIRALTGRDTDTIKEEKLRGISIDLGFTYFDLPGGERAGIIDVPGHEKFLPNMLAGVCGMDLVLLVIALDEGIKPQTREHMEILSQLNVRQGMIVLTKQDCVDVEWADLMEEEITEELKDTIFSAWPRIRVSAVTGEGIEELKKQIIKQREAVRENRDTKAAFRMPVDRVLTLEGRGTVIAGTVLDGKIRSGENIEIYPTGKCVRIRSIQSHGNTIDCAEAGQRAALLVAGMKKEEAARGNVAAAPGSLKNADRLDVRLALSKDTDRILKNRARVHLHIGTKQMLCRAVLFGQDELKAGESCYAQLLLEETAAVKKKDRFILRFYSPLETIGGGVVLNEAGKKYKRSDVNILTRFKQMEEDKEAQLILDFIRASADRMWEREELTSHFGEAAESICEENPADIMILRGKKKAYFTSAGNMERWYEQILTWLEQYRKMHPYQCRIPKKVLKKEVFSRWDNESFELFLNHLVQDDRLHLEKDLFSCRQYPVIKDKRFADTQDMLLQKLVDARFQFMNIGELCPEKMPEDMYYDILATLESEGEIVQISEELYTTAGLMREVISMVEKYFKNSDVLTYTALRDMLKTTRRSVRPLVAYFDANGITEPCGKETERMKGNRCII